jgi:RHS repeat-associated protein
MLTAYPFGLQELSYDAGGVFSSQLDSSSLAGHLIGWTDGTSTTYNLTDGQGSVLASLSASAVQGEQLYDPYGSHRYAEGTPGTDRGYTGQFTDTAAGLSYYNARYYLRHIGVFLSPDHVQGNAQGMDPYAYVGGNPETRTDPTGERMCVEDGDGVTCSKPGDGGGSGGSGGTYCYSGNCNGDPTKTHPNPCAAGPQSFNNCTYHGGDCDGKNYQQCITLRQEERARQDALNAEKHFKDIAGFLGSDWLDGILFALGIALSALDWWLAPIIGGIISGLGLAFAIIANMAGDLANFFSGDANRTDRSGKIDYAWFTKANLEGEPSQIANIVAGHSFSADSIGLMGALVTFFSAAMRGSASAADATDAGISILKYGMSAVTVEVIAVAAGAYILDYQADAYIKQEEAAVA